MDKVEVVSGSLVLVNCHVLRRNLAGMTALCSTHNRVGAHRLAAQRRYRCAVDPHITGRVRYHFRRQISLQVIQLPRSTLLC